MRGRPFQKGEDERRNLNGRGPGPTLPLSIRRQAREERENTIRRLVALRDQGKDLRIALEASKVLAEYADGKPGPAEPEPEEVETGLEEEIDVNPPPLDDVALSGVGSPE